MCRTNVDMGWNTQKFNKEKQRKDFYANLVNCSAVK